MKAITALGIVLGLVVGLAACAQQAWAPRDNYAYEVDDGRVYIRWNCFFQPTGLVMRGFVNSPVLMVPIKNTTLSVSGINAQGGTVSTVQAPALPYLIETNQRTPFEVQVPTTGTEVRFDMWYTYTAGGPFMDSNDQRGVKMDACPRSR